MVYFPIICFHLFQLVNFFFHLQCEEWVLCECNFSYNFSWIFLKHCIYCVHGLKMLLWFGQYRQIIIFFFFFTFFNLRIFRHLRCNEWVLCEGSFYNFIRIFLKLCKCFVYSLTICVCALVMTIKLFIFIFFNLRTKSFLASHTQ